MPCGPPANPSAWHYLISAAIMVLVNVLSWISLISPSRVGFSHYSMVAVSPQPNVAGPSVWLGPFSSCGRANASFETHCTYIGQLDLRFKYSLSVLPERVRFPLRAPPILLGVSLVLTAALLTVFLVLVIVMTGVLWFLAPHERFSNYKRALAWIAFVLFFIGSVNISILEFHFQTSRHVFNVISRGTGLVASRGDTINLAYAAYTLVFVPFCLIMKDVANIDDAHHINPMVVHLPEINVTNASLSDRSQSSQQSYRLSSHSSDTIFTHTSLDDENSSVASSHTTQPNQLRTRRRSSGLSETNASLDGQIGSVASADDPFRRNRNRTMLGYQEVQYVKPEIRDWPLPSNEEGSSMAIPNPFEPRSRFKEVGLGTQPTN